MIAKIMMGQSFGGCVRYVLNDEKAQLLKRENLPDGDHLQIAADFELQSELNPRVAKKVVHIALAFSPNDSELIDDDELMLKIAEEYMERMGVSNTQYLVARHTDREHPHCHIIYNRVDNDGRTISDKNDRHRSEKICKMLTAKYRLHFAEGKDQVNREQLNGTDAKKYYIQAAIKGSLMMCSSWEQFEKLLSMQGVKMEFKYNGNSSERQGVKFSYDGATFSGSKVDRAFSYSRLDSHFAYKSQTATIEQRAPPETVQQEKPSISENIASGALSIFSSLDSGSDFDEDEAAALRQQKLKKKRKGMRM